MEEPQENHADLTYKLFVGGIPRNTTESQLVNHFSRLGSVCARIFKKQSSKCAKPTRAANSSHKTYCVVETASEATYAAILALGEHYFGDRSITCTPYKTGAGLQQHNLNRNERRVIVKNVPGSATDTEVRDILVRLAGPLENFYRYKAESKNKTQTVKKRSTFSAMYASAEAAKRAARIGKATTSSGVSFIVEPYDSMFHKLLLASNTHASKGSSEEPNHPSPAVINKPKDQDQDQDLHTSPGTFLKNFPPSPRGFHSPVDSTGQEWNPNPPRKVARQRTSSEATCAEFWSCFCAKPTTQAYRRYRPQLKHENTNLLYVIG